MFGQIVGLASRKPTLRTLTKHQTLNTNLFRCRGGSGSCSGGLGLATGVALERPRWGELAQLVPNHSFGDVHLVERLAVVNEERRADEVRVDGAVPRPRLDRLLVHALFQHTGVKPLVDVRTFFD